VYQPALCCQFHKLRIEGELMRCMPDGLQWTVVRPTTYHPYVVSAIVLDEVRQGKSVSLFGSANDVGDLALYNPIAREDLGRFIVSCVLNQNTYGRVLAVGGPWSADNVATLKDCTNMMIKDVGGDKPSTIKPLGMNLSDIIYKFMEAFGHFSPTLKKVATIVFFYTKYWSTVSHFSPGTGVYDTRAYTAELVAEMKKDPEAFGKFVANAKKSTTASVVYPLPRNSWWDITQKSLSPDQIPMGAGKPPSTDDDEPRIVSEKVATESVPDEADATAECLMQLRAMAPVPICLGALPINPKDEPLYADPDEIESEWVKVQK
jgi:hypothetical protein